MFFKPRTIFFWGGEWTDTTLKASDGDLLSFIVIKNRRKQLGWGGSILSFKTFIISTGKMQQEPNNSEKYRQGGGQELAKYWFSLFRITRAENYYQFLLARHCVSALHAESQLIFKTTLWDGCRFCPQFWDEEMETQRSQAVVNSPMSKSSWAWTWPLSDHRVCTGNHCALLLLLVTKATCDHAMGHS